MATVSIDSRDVRAIRRALRFELQRYERSIRYYSEGDGANSTKASDNIAFAEDRIEELRDCIASLEDAQ
jgi:hypothetical protein